MFQVQKKNDLITQKVYDLPEWETIADFPNKEEAYNYKNAYLKLLRRHGSTDHLPVLRVVQT
jgi:hypothetical protein